MGLVLVQLTIVLENHMHFANSLKSRKRTRIIRNGWVLLGAICKLEHLSELLDYVNGKSSW